MWRWIALAIAVTATTAAAETPLPLRTPAELKSLHGPSFAGMQLLTYRRSKDSKTASELEITIGIGRNIIFRQEGENRRVVDLRLGRIYDIRGKRYVSHPLAADIVFRDTEHANRIALTKAMTAAGIEPDKLALIGEPFWNAVDLKVTSENESPPAVETRQDQNETVFLYKGVEVIRWRPMDNALPAPLAVNLRQVFLWFFKSHPYLDGQLASEGKPPQRITVRWQLAGTTHTDDYRLTSARWCATCEAVPADAQPGLWVGGVFERELAPVMIAASLGKFKTIPSDEYLRRIDAALERGAALEAWLWFMERLLQDGIRKCQPDEPGDYCRILRRMLSQAQADADIQVLRRHMSTTSTDAANTLANLRAKVQANSYYLDLVSMNTIPRATLSFKNVEQEPLKSAERRMVSVLTGMPLVPGVYRDIGNIYFAAVDTRRAWLAWEMGKANPGRSVEPNLWQHVTNLEAQVRRRHPEFFSAAPQ